MKKFDFVIGNPPYQETALATRDKPVYDAFMDAAYSISEKVELITPGRFLFDAGATPKDWNQKMLNDVHFKVIEYEPDATKIFSNVGFKGGVAIHYRDATKRFGAIGRFSVHPELNSILKRVNELSNISLSTIMYGQGSYKFTSKMHSEHPEVRYHEDENGNNIGVLSKGHDNDIATSALEKLDNIIMFERRPEDGKSYIRIVGRKNNVRSESYIREDYIAEHENLKKYKLILPKANGTGSLGELLSTPIVIGPNVGHTQTFLSIGCFNSEIEALNAMKYIKAKFTRVLLGILKITQDNPPEKWKFVPLQNFSNESDIDWSKSVAEIDQQLYKKYGLSDEEINFIETHVKEME